MHMTYTTDSQQDWALVGLLSTITDRLFPSASSAFQNVLPKWTAGEIIHY